MISVDPRCYPLVELSIQDVRAMLRPAVGNAELQECVRVEGGLVNTLYRVTTGGGAAYALRVYAAGGTACETECRLLSGLAKTLPVPEVLFADASGRRCAYPYLVYRWMEGINLNEFRRRSTPEAFLTLAEPLGRLLAKISGAAYPADCVSRTIRVATLLERAEGQLRAGLARERLGGALADDLSDCLKNSASVFRASVLVHGDFGGRNILVKSEEGGGWAISGVIDWEDVAAGSALWDIGSLFRYTRRYSEEFRAFFARGYRAAGRDLPPDWWLNARAIDATRLVAILGGGRELPGVFAECVELLRSVVAGPLAGNAPCTVHAVRLKISR